MGKYLRLLAPTCAAVVVSSLVAAAWDARPWAWCGWYARHQLVNRDPGPEYNRAAQWAHWGVASGPRSTAMIVWAHHVGRLEAPCGYGRWMVHSGNDGHMVRTRCRSIAGAIAFRVERPEADFQFASERSGAERALAKPAHTRSTPIASDSYNLAGFEKPVRILRMAHHKHHYADARSTFEKRQRDLDRVEDALYALPSARSHGQRLVDSDNHSRRSIE
jgi:hypothetical protein